MTTQTRLLFFFLAVRMDYRASSPNYHNLICYIYRFTSEVKKCKTGETERKVVDSRYPNYRVERSCSRQASISSRLSRLQVPWTSS
jgi:hypothetical protein